jgi:hypothetical protein
MGMEAKMGAERVAGEAEKLREWRYEPVGAVRCGHKKAALGEERGEAIERKR